MQKNTLFRRLGVLAMTGILSMSALPVSVLAAETAQESSTEETAAEEIAEEASEGGEPVQLPYDALADIEESEVKQKLAAIYDHALEATQSAGGTWSVYAMMPTEDGATFYGRSFESSKKRRAGDMIHLFIMGAVYDHAGEPLDEETKNQVRAMVCQGDTQAESVLLSWLGDGDVQAGMNAVNAFCEEKTFRSTSMGHESAQTEYDTENYTSAVDVARFMWFVKNGTMVAEEASSEMAYILKGQETSPVIAAALGTMIDSFESKGSQKSGSFADAALITSEQDSYILVAMADDVNNMDNAKDLVTDLSRQVFTDVTGKEVQLYFNTNDDRALWDSGQDADRPYDVTTKKDESFVQSMLEYACYWEGKITYASSQNGTDPSGLRFERLRNGGSTDCSWFVYHVLYKYGLIGERFTHSYEWGNNPEYYPGAHNIGTDISKASPGDIICTGAGERPQNSHVAIYIGDGMQVECGYGGGVNGVVISHAPSSPRQIVHFDCLP